MILSKYLPRIEILVSFPTSVA
uniref:Uncharacterized protein n=1 Tax=Rhizophora mucronata TaxID=61149 RepID=A0A2P2P4U1_RHIMU